MLRDAANATRPVSFIKNVCMTLNNYTEEERVSILNNEIFSYIVIGKEVGESGTPHLQMYGQLYSRTRFQTFRVRVNMRMHVEPGRGNAKDAANYCKKGEQSHDEWKELKEYGPHFGLNADWEEKGVMRVQGQRTDLKECVELLKLTKSVKRVAEEHPETYIKYFRGLQALNTISLEKYTHTNCRGLWIYGPPGTGKTHCARMRFPDAYIKQQSKWWCGYDGQEAVILDDFDTNCLGHYLKIWSDKWSFQAETKCGQINPCYKIFIVTSNKSIEELFTACEKVDHTLIAAIQRRFFEQMKLDRQTEIDFDVDNYFQQLMDD